MSGHAALAGYSASGFDQSCLRLQHNVGGKVSHYKDKKLENLRT